MAIQPNLEALTKRNIEELKSSATGAALAVTINSILGTITTEALVTAALTDFIYTVTNGAVTASSMVFVSLGQGTNTTGSPVVMAVTPAAGSFVIRIRNAHATVALNGTLVINYLVI